jgi:dGTPase
MDWQRLLNNKRIREIAGGQPSSRAATEQRDEFERDYGRTLYSTPVRRLRDKAQVYPLEAHDFVRTRLAHSLEVSSVARNLASDAARRVPDEFAKSHFPAIGTIAATCGLIHDLGNPPFGHAGELAMSTWFNKKYKADSRIHILKQGSQYYEDFSQFEGNAQTLRLVARLQVLADFHGLNLTCATFGAACKYTVPSHKASRQSGNHDHRKPGFFASEQNTIQQVTEILGVPPETRHPITFLVEAADDIVYSAVDLEDGIKKGLLSWDEVEQKLKAKCEECEALDKALTRTHEQIDPAGFKGKTRDDAMAQAFRTHAIGETVPSAVAVFLKNYDAIMEGAYHRELVADPSAATWTLVKACKDILKEEVYHDYDILRLEVMGREIIHDLMDLFWEAASVITPGKLTTATYPEKIYLLISENYRRVFEDSFRMAREVGDEAKEMYARLQLVTDQVAGMTDTFATTFHRQVKNAG